MLLELLAYLNDSMFLPLTVMTMTSCHFPGKLLRTQEENQFPLIFFPFVMAQTNCHPDQNQLRGVDCSCLFHCCCHKVKETCGQCSACQSWQRIYPNLVMKYLHMMTFHLGLLTLCWTVTCLHKDLELGHFRKSIRHSPKICFYIEAFPIHFHLIYYVTYLMNS